MDCNYTTIKTGELKGSTFRSHVLNFGDFDISGYEFTTDFANTLGQKVAEQTLEKFGNTVVLPLTVLEGKSGNIRADVWMSKDDVRDLAVRFEIMISSNCTGSSDTTEHDITVTFEELVIPVTVTQGIVNIYLDYAAADQAAENANNAAVLANEAAGSAQTAANEATQAASGATDAINGANTAASNANEAAGCATAATQEAATATGQAQAATSSANNAATAANSAATNANDKAAIAQTAANNADQKAAAAQTATTNANTATGNANAAASAANTAAQNALSGINLGFLTPSSPAAPPTGIHRGQAAEAGTYTNFGGIVVTSAELLANFVYIEVTNGVSKKVLSAKPLPNYNTGTLSPTSTDKAETGKTISDFVDDKMTTLRSVLVDSIVSKNLIYKIFDGVYINSTVDNGGYRVGAGWNMAVFEVEEGKTYTISGWNSSRKEIGIFSSTPPTTITADSSIGVIKSRSATYVFGYDKVNGKITFTAPAGAKWVGATVASSSEADTLFEVVQAEEGSVSTGYMPYGQVVYVPKKELRNDFALQILKNGDLVSVRSKFNNELDSVIQLSLNGGQNGASNLLNVWLIGNTLPITATPTNSIQNNGDAVPPPFQIRSGDTSSHLNIAGNHGLGTITDATATAHGKTSADLLSVWTDGTGWEWYLMEILSADSLRFASKPKNVSGLDKVKRDPGSPLTHVSGATNTGGISFTGSSYEYKPAINTISVKMYLDGVEITADGTYMGNEFKVIDTHNVVDPTQPTLTVPYLPQNNGTMVRNTLIHTFYGNSIYTAENIADWRKNHLLTNQGIIQPQVLLKQSFTSVMTYGMNVGTVGSIDFTNGFDISLLSANTYVNVNQLKDTTKSVQQLSQILMQGSSPKIGGGFGFNPLVGLGKSENLLQNTEHMMVSSAKKYYPRGYNMRNTETKILRGIGYFAFWDATINPKLAADYYVPHGNQDLYFINIRVAMTKEKVYLASALLNREFEIVHKSSGLTLHTEDAVTNEGLIVSGAVGEWAVLKIK